MNLLERLRDMYAGRPVQVVGPRPQVLGPQPALTVTPPARKAWDEKRWHRLREGVAAHYVGAYRVFDRKRSQWRTFDGRVIDDHAEIKAYVSDPPPELKTHRKGPCFQLVRAPWFRIHWHRAPKSVDDALLYVERLLDECLNE